MSTDTIYLVDGTSICYRSFFAIKLSNSKGFPTGAIYGFYQTLKKIINQYKPFYMGICFDVSRKTFRQDKFKAYKIQRPPLPDNLKSQIPIIKKLIGLLGIKLIEKQGYEADDIIASLCQKALKNNFSSVIVGSDKDMYQLLDNKKITVYDPAREELIDEEKFKKEFGFAPPLIIDYLSLVGDSVDNVPGAKGIGKVGASKLISEFGTIENVFKHTDELSAKVKEVLVREKENIILSRELVTLQYCDLDVSWQDLKIKEPDYSQIRKLFQEFEFKRLLKELPAPKLNIKVDIVEASYDSVIKTIDKDECVLYTQGFYAYVFDNNKESVFKIELEDAKKLLQDKSIKKISYDFKEQLSLLKDIKIEGSWFDVKIAAYLVDSSLPDYSLPTLASQYLGEFLPEVSGEVAPYFIYRLYKILYPKLKEGNLEELFFTVEMPLIDILYQMQANGVKIDLEKMDELFKEVDKRLTGVREKIFKIAGKEFNLNSPKQLSVVLFEELKIPPIKKTKTGFSTGEEVLDKLSSQFEIAKLIMQYRELNKLKTTYISPLTEDVKSKGGKIHAEFNQVSTQTGRLSSSSPNLQSIPIKGEFSSKLRSSFISSFNDGYIFCADYSQIELRILAHFSGDERLYEAFKNNLDIHSYTAALLFGVKEEDVEDTQRNLAKRVNFSIIYGMSAYGLSQELHLTLQQAETFIQDYFLRYPKVKEYIQRIYEEVEKNGFVTTILGRKRYLPDFISPNPQLKEFAMRQAVNTPIQGSCADLIKAAMVRICKEFQEKELQSKLIMQIHDELVFDIPKEELKQVAEIVKKNMEGSIKLSVQVKVNLQYGKNWADLQDVEA
ncbi:MAG: DNA polymerase I [Candidatus Omnitrophota bacterium]|nr:DNA polymerase I [Candidatus Omnitrophota bacterium]